MTIQYIATDMLLYEKQCKDHLAYIRSEFDNAPSQSKQYDIILKARKFYDGRQEVEEMRKDIEFSDKKRF